MNPNLKKIIDSEKEDINTVKKLMKGEKVVSRVDWSKIDPLKLLAEYWIFSIVLLCFLAGGFFLGVISFENVCNDALLEIQDDCNEFYGGQSGGVGWMNGVNFSNSSFSISSNNSINIED